MTINCLFYHKTNSFCSDRFYNLHFIVEETDAKRLEEAPWRWHAWPVIGAEIWTQVHLTLNSAIFPVHHPPTGSWTQLGLSEPPSDLISLLFLADSKPGSLSYVWPEALVQINRSTSWMKLYLESVDGAMNFETYKVIWAAWKAWWYFTFICDF